MALSQFTSSMIFNQILGYAAYRFGSTIIYAYYSTKAERQPSKCVIYFYKSCLVINGAALFTTYCICIIIDEYALWWLYFGVRDALFVISAFATMYALYDIRRIFVQSLKNAQSVLDAMHIKESKAMLCHFTWVGVVLFIIVLGIARNIPWYLNEYNNDDRNLIKGTSYRFNIFIWARTLSFTLILFLLIWAFYQPNSVCTVHICMHCNVLLTFILYDFNDRL